MTTTESRTYARTIYEARLDAECYACSHTLHIRLWRKFQMLMRVINGFGGSAAFAGWLANRPDFVGLSGLVIAFATALDQAIDPAGKMAAHKIAAQRYSDLRKASLTDEMGLVAFEARLEEIKADDEAGIQALLVRACNLVLRGAGRADHLIPETTLQRIIAFFA